MQGLCALASTFRLLARFFLDWPRRHEKSRVRTETLHFQCIGEKSTSASDDISHASETLEQEAEDPESLGTPEGEHARASEREGEEGVSGELDCLPEKESEWGWKIMITTAVETTSTILSEADVAQQRLEELRNGGFHPTDEATRDYDDVESDDPVVVHEFGGCRTCASGYAMMNKRVGPNPSGPPALEPPLTPQPFHFDTNVLQNLDLAEQNVASYDLEKLRKCPNGEEVALG
ncbi:MAG: hypothetical protein Q9184_001208 [Pyrenodesmia sp. 2 TL-2023]